MNENFNELEVPILFNRMNKNFNKGLGDFLVSYGLSKLHSFYMVCLYIYKKGLTLNQLNFLTGFDKANTSRAISDMEEKGIVDRVSNNTNRKYKVVLTEKGFNIGKDFIKTVKENIKKTFSVLTESEMSTFRFLVSKLLKGECYDTN